MGVEGFWVYAEEIGGFSEGVETIAIGVDADLRIVCEVFLEGELACQAEI